MRQLNKVETSLDEFFNKQVPIKMSEKARKSLAGAMWWMALIAGIAQLYLAWRLWDSWRALDALADYANSYAATFGVQADVRGPGFLFFCALVAIIVSGALLLLASPGLKEMKKAGWNLIFYSLLVNLAYGVFVLFSDYGDFGHLVGAALGSLVAGFLLFQVRGQFSKSGAGVQSPKPQKKAKA